MRRAAGFTLIEIMVVLLILSSLIGLAATNMQRMMPSSATESGARQLLGLLDLARTQAISRGYAYEVQIDLEEQRYRILTPFDRGGNPSADPEDRTGLQWNRLPEGVLLEAVLDEAGLRQERGLARVTFRPSGESHDFWAYLTHEAGEDAYRVTVRVLGLTGLASLMAGEQSPPEVREADF
jgi:prepilin-type N-terminal cleavage/methylation domain-containing protein